MKKPPLHSIYPIKDLRDLLIQVTDRYGDRIALRSKKNGAYQSLTYSELGERVTELATAFLEWDLKKRDGVAILSENRTEWAVTYLAAVTAGLVAVPIDKDLTDREICHILNFSKPRVLGEEFVLRAGDSIEVPCNAAHSAQVVGEVSVVSLDAVKKV